MDISPALFRLLLSISEDQHEANEDKRVDGELDDSMLEDALPVGDLERLVLALQEELIPDELFPELQTLVVELNGL